jgi:phosphotransferase system  glucose/maltose/N-acetylglucosamine-specific IIC component
MSTNIRTPSVVYLVRCVAQSLGVEVGGTPKFGPLSAAQRCLANFAKKSSRRDIDEEPFPEGRDAMSEKELLQGLPPYLFATAAAASFALAVYLAVHDRKGASGILAAMAFVAALLAYLPQLDSLGAFEQKNGATSK